MRRRPGHSTVPGAAENAPGPSPGSSGSIPPGVNKRWLATSSRRDPGGPRPPNRTPRAPRRSAPGPPGGATALKHRRQRPAGAGAWVARGLWRRASRTLDQGRGNCSRRMMSARTRGGPAVASGPPKAARQGQRRANSPSRRYSAGNHGPGAIRSGLIHGQSHQALPCSSTPPASRRWPSAPQPSGASKQPQAMASIWRCKAVARGRVEAACRQPPGSRPPQPGSPGPASAPQGPRSPKQPAPGAPGPQAGNRATCHSPVASSRQAVTAGSQASPPAAGPAESTPPELASRGTVRGCCPDWSRVDPVQSHPDLVCAVATPTICSLAGKATTSSVLGRQLRGGRPTHRLAVAKHVVAPAGQRATAAPAAAR